MKNLSIKLDITVGGAILMPNQAQYNAIKKAITTIIFDDDGDTGNMSVKTKVTKIRWTEDEREFAMQLLKNGYKYADIADKLNRRFGRNRTKHGVAVRLDKAVRQAKTAPGIFERVAESNQTPAPAVPSEFNL